MPDAIVHVSAVAGSPLLDSAGERLGQVEDVVAQLDSGEDRPPVIGLKARIGGRELFVPASRIERLEPDAARTATTKLNLAQFERRPGEVLLRADLLDRSLINVETARLVRAREVELVCEDGTWRVAGIDPSFRTRLWRLLPRRFRGHDTEHTQFIAWENMEPFVAHVPTSRLKLASRTTRTTAPGPDRRPRRGRQRTRRARRSCKPLARTRNSKRTCSRSSTTSTRSSFCAGAPIRR